tara:strand:- start:251 stop:457 length:207 start_codon:yes stop_codon:yes gene_type:complete
MLWSNATAEDKAEDAVSNSKSRAVLIFQQFNMAIGQGVNGATSNCLRINLGPQPISSSGFNQEIIGSN